MEIPDKVYEEMGDVARNLSRRYDWEFEADDIRQEIAMDYIAFPSRYQCNEYQLTQRLYGAGYRYCEKERRRYLHYSDQYIYSSNDVRSLLKRYYDDDIESVEKLDLVNAMKALREKHLRVLVKRYVTGDKLSEYERKLLNETVKILTHQMNTNEALKTDSRGWHEGPGSRRAITNANALAINSNM